MKMNVTEDQTTNEVVVEKIVVVENECNNIGGFSNNIPFSAGSDDHHHHHHHQQQQQAGPSTANVSAPSFLTKTFDMVEDPQTNNLISWSLDGESFIVSDHNVFAIELLPKYFRHNHFSSFHYQLNNYGFRKIEYDKWEYYHPCFRRGQPQLLESIKRRVPNYKKKAEAAKLMQAEIMKLRNQNNTLRMEMEKVKQKQEIIEVCKDELQETLDSAIKSFKTPLVVLLHEFMDQLTRDERQPEEAENANDKKPRLAEPTSQTGAFSVESYGKFLLGEDEDNWALRAMNEADEDVFDDQSRIFMELQNLLGKQVNGPDGDHA